MQTVGVLGDAFTGARALERESRLALARAMRCGHRNLDNAPLGDLTDPHFRRRLRLAVRRAAESAVVQQRWSGVAFADLFPAASRLGDGDVQCVGAPRLRGVLERHSADRWTSLLPLTVGEIGDWCNAGPKAVADLVGFAFERSLLGLLTAGSVEWPGAAADLVTVCDGDAATVATLRVGLAGLVDANQSHRVAEAAARLVRLLNTALPPTSGTGFEPELEELLAAAGDERDVAVFVDRELAIRDRRPSVHLQRRLRLSPERVRQLRVRAADRVRAAAADAGPELTEILVALRQRLGSVAPLSDVEQVVAAAGLPAVDSNNGSLAVWLAGPYRSVSSEPTWIGLAPDELRVATRQLLSEDGGVRLVAEGRQELAALGVVDVYRDRWLSACGGVLVDDMVVSGSGPLDPVLERLLFALGRPAPAAELASFLRGAFDEREVAARLARSRRFASAGVTAYELVEWRAASARRSGARPVAAATAAARLPAGTPDLDGRLWLKVRVDAGVLAGAAVCVPADLVETLGVGAHQRQAFAGRFGPAILANDPPGPTLVSLRPIARAAGAASGDTLVLGFGSSGQLTVRLAADDTIEPELSPVPPLTVEGAL